MNLSALVRLTHLKHHPDDLVEDVIVVHAVGRPTSAVEAVVEHTDLRNECIRQIRRNGLGVDQRLAEAIILMLWRWMMNRRQDPFASELLWIVTDLRPILYRNLYFRDARNIDRKMTAFHPTALVGPDVLTTVID